MANLIRATVKMSQGGRSNRDTHTLVTLCRPTGVYNYDALRAFGTDFIACLASVMFAPTHFLGISFAQVTNEGVVIPGNSFTMKSNAVGDNAIPGGGVYASEKTCLILGKETSTGQGSEHIVRHILTAAEWAAYLTSGTIPARFTVSPDDSFGEGDPFGTNLLLAASAHNIQYELPPTFAGVTWTTHPVTAFSAQEFDERNVFKRRKSASRSAINGVQRELNKFARDIVSLLNPFDGVTPPLEVIQTVNSLVTAALAIYTGVQIADRVKIVLPAAIQLLALPA